MSVHDTVISAAIGYQPKDISLFLQTLRAVFNGRVIIIVRVDQVESFAKFKEVYNLELFVISENDSSTPHLDRYFEYQKVIKYNPDIHRIFLTDSRDVLFQATPFRTDAPHLYFFTEPNLIRNCRINSRWISQHYGVDFTRSIGEQLIICSGTTMGTRDAILAYLEIMCDEIYARKSSGVEIIRGNDQGFHNHLFYSGKIPYATLRLHGRSEVQTLSQSLTLLFDRACFLLNEDKSRVPVIHQYDRFPQFFAIFARMIRQQNTVRNNLKTNL